jgi:isopenicillin N synthase-like dioxygenase
MYYLKQQRLTQWSRWHPDHELLQAITCPLFVDENTGRKIEMQEMDYQTSLHLRTRRGEEVKVLGEDEFMFVVMGDALQIISGGRLKATPHAVINDGNMGKVSRSTFVMFCPPKNDLVLECPDEGTAFNDNTGLPSLRNRWKKGMTFEELDKAAIA